MLSLSDIHKLVTLLDLSLKVAQHQPCSRTSKSITDLVNHARSLLPPSLGLPPSPPVPPSILFASYCHSASSFAPPRLHSLIISSFDFNRSEHGSVLPHEALPPRPPPSPPPPKSRQQVPTPLVPTVNTRSPIRWQNPGEHEEAQPKATER